MSQPDSIELFARLRGGDQAAAAALYDQYASRLIGLVRVHLSEKLARRFDAEDVVQSAFRSFFVGTREGRYLLQHSGKMWNLLVSIALHKLHHSVSRHQAGKRAVAREEVTGLDVCVDEQHEERLRLTPSAEEAVMLAEEIEEILSILAPREQRMFELRLEGYTLDEIAQDAGRSQRTVRRVMERIRGHMLRKEREYGEAQQ